MMRVYLDNAATTKRDKDILKYLKEYYLKYNGNPHSKMNYYAQKSMEIMQNARNTIAKYFNIQSDEVVFTKSATESLNILAYGLEDYIDKNEEIVISIMEHHSNLIPWQNLAKKKEAKLKYVYLNSNNSDLDYDALKNMITEKTKIVSITLCSNVLGIDIDYLKVFNIVNDENNRRKKIDPENYDKNKIILIFDAAQYVQHGEISLKYCDAFVFSAHKLYSPMGVGILAIKKELIKILKPLLLGGGMIDYVLEDTSKFANDFTKFEGGTQNVADIYAFYKILEKMQKEKNSKKLYQEIQNTADITRYTYEELSKIKNVKIISSIKSKGIVSFVVDGIHSHDLATLLDEKGICVRAGHHCTMPLHKYLKITSSLRVSFSKYNTKRDAVIFIKVLKEVLAFWNSNIQKSLTAKK